MAHFALCPRADMTAAPPATLNNTMERSPKQSASAALLTWQQQKDFGTNNKPHKQRRRRKAPKFVPLDLEAIEPKQDVTAIDSVQDASQLERSAPEPVHRQPRTQRKRQKPYHTKGKLHSKPSQPDKGKSEEMTARPEGVYLPPHMRKRTPAPAKLNTDVKLGNSIGVGSPPPSTKSQLNESAQDQVSAVAAATPDHSPPSPPTTEEHVVKAAETYNGWDDPIPEHHSTPPKRNGNPRWPRVSRAPKQRHVWPKARDIPKGLSSGDQSDGGVKYASDSDGDPAYDVKKLMDWNGDWLPPPEQWAARKGFTNRHFGQAIEQWMDGHSRNCTKLMDIDSPAFLGVEDTDGKWLTKDLVPRYWIHETIDNDAIGTFWKQLPSRMPTALSNVDIMEDPPYWERWEDDDLEHCFMNALVVPDATIDRNDPENELESAYSLLCTNDRLRRIQEIKDNKQRRSEARRNRPVPVSTQVVSHMPDRRLTPKANIYLRPVHPADVRGIMTIYNHYIKNTVHAHEIEERTEHTIRCRIDDIIKAGLPFLVAVAKRNQRKGPQGYVSETIVGYVHLDDYVDQSSMYRYTFELELFVHPGYLCQGVGKCLLDKIMYMANTGYNARGGYEWINDFEYLKNGKGRVIKTVLVTLHYERSDQVEWATEYLGLFGFKKAGRFSQVGHKLGKVVDKVLFQLQTTEVVDPNSVPMVQG